MATQPQAPDLTAIKGRQQKAWSSGDYGKVGATLVIMAEMLCEAVDLRPGQRVLDVACGNGNAALAAARRFGEVVGIDYVPSLLEEGRERARAEGWQVDFQEGDAEDLEARRQDRDGQLDARRLPRRLLPDHGQARPTACRSEASLPVGSRGAVERTLWGRPQIAKHRTAQLRMAFPVGRVLCGVHEGLLWPPVQGLRGARYRGTAKSATRPD